MSFYAKVQKNIANVCSIVKDKTSAQYAKETLLGVGVLAMGLIGYNAHSFYLKNREERAFGALIEVSESFDRTQYEIEHEVNSDKINNETMWQDTEVLTDALYKQNSGSFLAPYFLIFKSQIALERGASIDEVIAIIEEALKLIPRGTPLFELHNLKRILMSFDSLDESVRKKALSDLIVAAKDERGYSFEEASYMLGLYYMSQNDMSQASEAFERVLKNSEEKALFVSPWVKSAEEKLASIKHV